MVPITAFPKRFAAAFKGHFIRSTQLLPHMSAFRGQNSVALKTTMNAPVPKATRPVQKATSETISWEPSSRNEVLNGQPWYTGKDASSNWCPGMRADGCLTSLALPNLETCTREEVLDYFDNTWALTELLFSALHNEAVFMRPPYHELRHPLIFYYGHPAALYINKLRVAGLTDSINKYYETIFETGVDEMGWDDMSKNHMEWPSLAEVHVYRKQCYETVRDVILEHEDLAPGHAPITQQHPLWSLFLAFEHERIHLETSSVLFRELPVELLSAPEAWPPYHHTAYSSQLPVTAGPAAPIEMLPVPETTVTLGKPADYPSFGWDNEYGHRSFDLKTFYASRDMITNAQFLEFVADNGYMKQEHWDDDGWGWRSFRNVKHPTFWVRTGPQGLHEYDLRLIFDEVPLARVMDWPVEVNYHEARAFCRWASARDHNGDGSVYRLPTEPENTALRGESNGGERSASALPDPVMQTMLFGVQGDASMIPGCDDGVLNQVQQQANSNLRYSSASPVGAYPPSSSGHGHRDVMGNVWEWHQDFFCALPGFKVHPYYEDFSTPCFDGEHQVILGGSFISTGANGASRFSRFHFRPHFFQHAGFRVVSDRATGATNANATGANEHVYTTCIGAPPPYTGRLAARERQRAMVDSEASRTTEEREAQMVEAQMSTHYGGGHSWSAILPHMRHALGNATHASSHADAAQMDYVQQIAQIATDAYRAFNAASDAADGFAQNGTCQYRALDVGCGAGGITFALASSGQFDQVTGVDIHDGLIKAAESIQGGEAAMVPAPTMDPLSDMWGRIPSSQPRDQSRSIEGTAVQADARKRVDFKRLDCMCVPNDMLNYDVVVASNILEELPSPATLLSRMGGPLGLVKKGGVLILSSTYGWDASYTPVEAWPMPSAEEATAIDPSLAGQSPSVRGIHERLGEEFELVQDQDVPMLVAKSSHSRTRLFDIQLPHVTVWRRRV